MNLWPKAVEICEGFPLGLVLFRDENDKCTVPDDVPAKCSFRDSRGNCTKPSFNMFNISGGLTPGRLDAHPRRLALSPGLACATEP